MEQSLPNDSLPLDEVLRRAVRHELSELRVALPGRIESYDPATGLASVQPLLQRRYRGRKRAGRLPIVHKVPVMHPRTGKAAVRFPVAKGDLVLLVFADRALENWVAGDGSPKEPLDVRMHDLSDALAIPGAYPSGDPPPSKYPEALEIHLGAGTKFALTNGANELIDLLVQAIDLILTDAHSGNLGYPTSASLQAAQWLILKTKLQTFLAI